MDVGPDAVGSSLNYIRIYYDAGSNPADVSNVDKTDVVRFGVDRNGDGVIDDSAMGSAMTVGDSNNGHTLTIQNTSGPTNLAEGDVIIAEFRDVQNPGSAGDYTVQLGLNGEQTAKTSYQVTSDSTSTATETSTSTPTATPTATETSTPTATATATDNGTSTAGQTTETETATETERDADPLTSTSTPTATPNSTSTPTATPTATPTPTETASPTATPTIASTQPSEATDGTETPTVAQRINESGPVIPESMAIAMLFMAAAVVAAIGLKLRA